MRAQSRQLLIYAASSSRRVGRAISAALSASVMRLKEIRLAGLFCDSPERTSATHGVQTLWQRSRRLGSDQTLPEKIVSRLLKRLFFCAEDCFIIQMSRYGCGQLIHSSKYERVGAQFSLDYETVPAELMAHEMDEFIAWNSEQWFAALEKVARKPNSDLAQTLAYLVTDDESKVRRHFGCSMAAFSTMRSLLKAALIEEATGGSLVHLENIKWRYWMEASRALDFPL